MARKFEFGQRVKDAISGFCGMVIGYCDYMTGCEQYLVAPKCKDDGDWVESRWMDVDRLDLVHGKSQLTLATSSSPGGAKSPATK